MTLPFKILYHHYTIMVSPDHTVQRYGIRPVCDGRCRRGSSGSQKKEFHVLTRDGMKKEKNRAVNINLIRLCWNS